MPQYLGTVINLLPVIVPGITGLALSVAFKRRAPRPALLVAIASVILLLQAGFQIATRSLLLPLAGNDGLSWEAYSFIVSTVHFVLGASVLGLLLAAAFVGRPAETPPADQGTPAEPHRGTLVLVLGLVGMLIFSPLGLVAWVLGVQELRAMDRGQRDPAGRGMALAGMIFGILATVMLVVFLVTAGVYVYAFLDSPGWRY